MRPLLMLTVVVGLGLGLGAGGCGPEDPLGERAQAIVGGKPSAARPAVGLINTGCTGTLIHPHVVLTAAHCCESGACTSFELSGTKHPALRSIRHPSFYVNADGGIAPNYDVQLLVLATAVRGVTPMKLSSGRPAKNKAIELVGFGCTDLDTNSGGGIKRVGRNVIALVGNSINLDEPVRFKDTFAWTAAGTYASANTCPGDSGGPTIWNEGATSVVAGVHTLVGQGFGYSTAVTARRSWITSHFPECSSGDERPCNECGVRKCTKSLAWSSVCRAPDPAPVRACPGGDQRCGPGGKWGTCEVLPPPPAAVTPPAAAAEPAPDAIEDAPTVNVIGGCALARSGALPTPWWLLVAIGAALVHRRRKPASRGWPHRTDR